MVVSDPLLIKLIARCTATGKVDESSGRRGDVTKLREVVDLLRVWFPKDIEVALRGSKDRVLRQRAARRRATLEFLRTDSGLSFRALAKLPLADLPLGVPSNSRGRIDDNIKRIARNIREGRDPEASAILDRMRERKMNGGNPWEGGGGITRAEAKELEDFAREHGAKYRGKLR